MKTRTKRWDAASYLDSEEDMAAYLAAAFEDGDPGVVTAALGDIARAKGMTRVARKAGLGRESLYKALSPNGNPELATVLRVVEALGFKLCAVPAE
jgi:probable addiction module antidote protein